MALVKLCCEYYSERWSWLGLDKEWWDHLSTLKLSAFGAGEQVGNDWTEDEWTVIEEAVTW